MSADKVIIDYDLLTGVRESIKAIIAELEDAPERTNDVAGAIDEPFELPQLSALAAAFRGSWEPKRGDLISTLEDIEGYIGDIVDSYFGLDRWI